MPRQDLFTTICSLDRRCSACTHMRSKPPQDYYEETNTTETRGYPNSPRQRHLDPFQIQISRHPPRNGTLDLVNTVVPKPIRPSQSRFQIDLGPKPVVIDCLQCDTQVSIGLLIRN